MYRPVKNSLLDPLAVVFRDPRPERAAERTLAANLLADYAADNPPTLADLLMDADDRQFTVIFAKLRDQVEKGLPILIGVIDTALPADLPSSDEQRETLAKRQANAAVALLRMNRPEKVWELLRHRPDPRVRSYLIHRLSPLGADPAAILKHSDVEPDITIRRALLLSLGEFDDETLPVAARTAVLPKLQAIYRTEADPGLHAAAEWLLRKWGQEAWLAQVNEEWAADEGQRAKRIESIQQQIKTSRQASAPGAPQWYVNSQGQTFVVIPGPVEFLMGSPKSGRPLESPPKPGRTVSLRFYYPGSAWMNPLVVCGYEFETPIPMITPEGAKPFPPTGYRTLNARTGFFYLATGITPAMSMRLTGID
jgi:hypothetical protein